MREARAGDTLVVKFQSFSNGASVTITGLAVTDIEVYKGSSMTQRSSDAGYTLLDTDGIDLDGITGIHGFSIDLSDDTDAGFFATGSEFTVIVSSITVDGQTVNFIAEEFRIVAAEAIAGKPKVDVDAWLGTAAATPAVAGRPSVDAIAISGSTTAADNIETAGTNYSATRGLAGTALPAAAADAAGGLPVSDAGGLDIDTKLANTNEVTAARMGALTDWINGGRLDLIIDDILLDTGTTLQGELDGIQATIGVAGAGLTDLGGMSTTMKAQVEAEVDDALGGGTGTALTAIPWNAAWDAEVQSEVDDALVVQKLDHLVAVADADDVVDNSIIAKLASKGATADWSGFVNTTDALEAIRDRGDAAWTTATSVTVSDKTGFSLSATGLDLVTAWTVNFTGNLSGSVGSVTGLTASNLDATVSSRMATTHIAATAGKVDGVALVDTTTTNTDMRGTDSAATAASLATAQADLDLLTGADGATLATSQPNYVPAVAGDAMALTSAERNSVADALLDRADGVETGLTPRGALRLKSAVLAGKVSGAGSATEVFRNAVADSKARITATVDPNGNRTAITYDAT